jgi:DNA-binding winged helix-turn-helix (wHTH) protein
MGRWLAGWLSAGDARAIRETVDRNLQLSLRTRLDPRDNAEHLIKPCRRHDFSRRTETGDATAVKEHGFIAGTKGRRVLGLEMGANDYLPKPFDPRELVAKIKVILRRARSMPNARRADSIASIGFAGWQLDTRVKQMLSPEGVIITLGGSDYRTLRTRLDHPNRPLSREYLLDEVFGKNHTPLDRAIDVCISRLRQHLKDTARDATLIRTVRNEGYMLTADVSYEG